MKVVGTSAIYLIRQRTGWNQAKTDKSISLAEPRGHPLALPHFSRYFPPAVAKVYIVSFRSHDDRRPSKFIVVADNRKEAIKIAWEHGGPDFQSRFDKSAGQAQEMKEGALRVLAGSGASRCQRP